MISASRRFGLLLTTLAGLGVVACGSEAPKPEQAAAPNAVPAPPSSVEVPAATSPVEISDEMPESLPGDLPLLTGLSPTSVRSEKGAGVALGFAAQGGVAQVTADYVALLESEGWTAVQHEIPEGTMIIASRGTANAVVQVLPGDSGAVVRVVATP